MKRRIDRRDALFAGAALCATLAGGRASACEAWARTLRVTHPWSRATREGATTATINLVIDEVSEDDRLIGARTPIATDIELAGEGVGPGIALTIPMGAQLLLGEGAIHLRLVGLTQQLLLGRSFPLQLVFEKGGTVYTSLNVDQLPLRDAAGAARPDGPAA